VFGGYDGRDPVRSAGKNIESTTVYACCAADRGLAVLGELA
jgi:hypothetical protein